MRSRLLRGDLVRCIPREADEGRTSQRDDNDVEDDDEQQQCDREADADGAMVGRDVHCCTSRTQVVGWADR